MTDMDPTFRPLGRLVSPTLLRIAMTCEAPGIRGVTERIIGKADGGHFKARHATLNGSLFSIDITNH